MKRTAILLGLGVGVLALIASSAFAIERNLSERRRQLASNEVYWHCDVVPTDTVLARVYAGRMILEHRPRWKHGIKWNVSYFVYANYLRFRLAHDELEEAFLKTPSNNEKGCKPVMVGSQ